MNRSLKSQELVAVLERALAQPPARAGRRLCSEWDLSSRLGVDRMKVHRSLDLLVEKGILVRRHGSGTYVRKVPRFATESAEAGMGDGPWLSAKNLFAKPSTTPVRRQPGQEHRRLQLALFDDQGWDSESNRSIFAGIMDRAKQAGHLLKIYPTDSRKDDSQAVERLAAKLCAHPCDGYILRPCHAPVMAQAFHGRPPPAVFVGAGAKRTDLPCAPLVRIDMEDAIVRAIRLLAAEGYRRIGFIGYASFARHEEERELYEDTMAKLKLPYRASEFCPLNDKAVLPMMRRMFAPSVRPEAVYVGDDIVLRHVLPAWRDMGVAPGADLGVITLAARGNPLPDGFKWSRMEFNPFQVGRVAVDCLLQEIQTAGEELCSFAHLAVWRPGATHRRDNAPSSILNGSAP